MSSQGSQADFAARRHEFYQRLKDVQMAPLWERLSHLLSDEPRVASRPHLWNYRRLRPLLLEAAQIISAEEAQRRVLVLENPGLPGSSSITESLYAGLQIIMPGETAPAHRHSPSALRLVLEGRGAFTAVNGERAYMEPGDFIITPAWSWHDHGHEGDSPVMWLDVLDLPIIRLLGPVFTEHYAQPRYPEAAPPRDSLYRFGYNLLPARHEPRSSCSPVFSYSYARVREALDHLERHTAWDPCHGLLMEYVDPTSGGPAMSTISTYVQLLPKNFSSDVYRSTDGTVCCVIEGSGRVRTSGGDGDGVLDYEAGDVFVVPCWCPWSLQADACTVLFRASDRVVQRKLGVWRERRGSAAPASA